MIYEKLNKQIIKCCAHFWLLEKMMLKKTHKIPDIKHKAINLNSFLNKINNLFLFFSFVVVSFINDSQY